MRALRFRRFGRESPPCEREIDRLVHGQRLSLCAGAIPVLGSVCLPGRCHDLVVQTRPDHGLTVASRHSLVVLGRRGKARGARMLTATSGHAARPSSGSSTVFSQPASRQTRSASPNACAASSNGEQRGTCHEVLEVVQDEQEVPVAEKSAHSGRGWLALPSWRGYRPARSQRQDCGARLLTPARQTVPRR